MFSRTLQPTSLRSGAHIKIISKKSLDLSLTAYKPYASSGFIDGGSALMIAAFAAFSDSSSFFSAGASSGGWQTMRTPRGLATGTKAPGGWKRCVPMTLIGTMRTPARAAIVKGPFLKSATRPSFERVPSGKLREREHREREE